MSSQEFTPELKAEARECGFDLVGVCSAREPGAIERFQEWLARGYAGEMRYLSDRASAYADPGSVLDGVKSIVMLGMNYRTTQASAPTPGQGRVSCYAWGNTDYHDVIHARLRKLKEFIRERIPTAKVRGVVDTAPLLEREFARLAGLGWVGKNTMLLNKEIGSWFFLAALLTDIELTFDEAFQTDHCGTCTACLDACPTDAFPEPYVLNATKCISYLTIELRNSIPSDLRAGVGDWLFGCDVCQDVCPWNRRAPISQEPAFPPQTQMDPVDLCALFELDDTEFRKRFRQTPLWRSKRRGILRNAAIVLGNQRPAFAIEPLIRGLKDKEPLVRSACAWALGRYDKQLAGAALDERLRVESDEEVRREIAAALRGHEQDSSQTTVK